MFYNETPLCTGQLGEGGSILRPLVIRVGLWGQSFHIHNTSIQPNIHQEGLASPVTFVYTDQHNDTASLPTDQPRSNSSQMKDKIKQIKHTLEFKLRSENM